MAGPMQETSAQPQAAKRSAEADPEPSPVSKRPSEQKEQEAQPMQTSSNKEISGNENVAHEQPAMQGGYEESTVKPSAPTSEECKTPAGSQPTSNQANNGKSVEGHPPVNNQPANQSGCESKTSSTSTDPSAIASQLAAEAAAAQEEAQKVAKVAAQKQAKAVEALQAAANVAPAEQQEPAKREVKEASEEKIPSTEPGIVKSTDGSNRSHTDVPSEALQSEQKIPEAALEKQREQNASEAKQEKVPQAPARGIPTEIAPQNSVSGAEIKFPPPTASLAPANPLVQTAQTPLIGNIPPQVVETLQAAHQAASMLPLEPTQEILEQQAATRTTPLAQPVDQGVAPMEE